MIPVSSIHYGILQQANHTDSEYLNETTVPQRDYYINKVKRIVVEWLTSQDETNDTIRRYLQSIVKRDVQLSYSRVGDVYIAKYPADFYKQKALYAIATLTGCELEKRIKIRRPTSEKFQSALDNKHVKKIWDFKQTVAKEGDDGIHVVTEPDVNLDIYMDYIRMVEDVAYPSGAKGGSYIGSDGNPVTEDKHLDLEYEFFFNKIVNLAVLEIKKDYTDLQDYQSQRDFILSIDRI
jgi:hypothetical protein